MYRCQCEDAQKQQQQQLTKIPIAKCTQKTIANKASLHLKVFELRSHKLPNAIRVVCAIVSSLKQSTLIVNSILALNTVRSKTVKATQ